MLKIICFFCFICYSCSLVAESYIPIFNGKDMQGWSGNPKVWKITDGVLWAEIRKGEHLRKNEFIYYHENLKDFKLKLQYRIHGANSGIQIRSQKDKYNHAVGYQADLDDGKTWLGRIYDEHGRRLIQERGELTKIDPKGKRHRIKFKEPDAFRSISKKGQWNDYEITCVGHRIEIVINGVLFSILEDYQEGQADLEGLIALQLHSGKGFAKIEFKNIQLMKLEQDNEDLAKMNFNQSPLLWSLNKQVSESTHSTQDIYVPEGFNHEVVVSEQQVRQPIAFTFDAKGRIWVAEAMAYPIRKKEGGEDRLVIYEDKNNDGLYEDNKIFVDNLNLISGFELGYGGVFVGAAPDFIFIPDADFNDIPDGPARVLLDGFDTRDTHETQNSFIWGPDGWLYGTHGVFNNSLVGKPGTPKEERILFRAGVWRYHPTKHEFEVYAHGGSNPWGLDFNEVGEMFITHCRSNWGRGPVSQVFRDAFYWTQNNKFIQDFIASDTTKWRRTDEYKLENMFHGIAAYGHGEGGAGVKGSKALFGGHSHVGTMIYLGNNWPREYVGQLYTHNLHGKRINREILEPLDSGYLSYSYGKDHLHSKDPDYLAVDLKTGPDGAVYSIDWVDRQKCHTKKNEVWDKTSGRVYRMSWSETYQPIKVNLADATSDELIEYLHHDNEWQVRMAGHLLRQRYAAGQINQNILSKLEQKIWEGSSRERFKNLSTWLTLGGMNNFELVSKLLMDSNKTIRQVTLKAVTEANLLSENPYKASLLNMAEHDESSRVRLTLAGVAQKRVDANLSKELIEILAIKNEDKQDRFIPKMLWYASKQHMDASPKWGLSLALRTTMQNLRDSIYWYLSKKYPAEVMVHAHQHLPDYDLVRVLAVINQGNQKINDNSPKEWSEIRKRIEKMNKKGALAIVNQLEEKMGLKQKTKQSGFDKKKARAAFALCTPCHMPGKAMPGPSLEEIAKVYKNEKDLMAWVMKPGKKRSNYPQMPAFEHLDKESLSLIAKYLISLK